MSHQRQQAGHYLAKSSGKAPEAGAGQQGSQGPEGHQVANSIINNHSGYFVNE